MYGAGGGGYPGAPAGGGGYPGAGGGGYPGAPPAGGGGYPGAPPAGGGSYPGAPPSGGYPGAPPAGGGGYPGAAGGYPGSAPPPFNPQMPAIRQDIQQWFAAVDQDRSGKITCKELQQALTNGNWSNFSEESCRMMISESKYT